MKVVGGVMKLDNPLDWWELHCLGDWAVDQVVERRRGDVRGTQVAGTIFQCNLYDITN